MTFVTTAPTSGRVVTPAWTRRVKTASDGADRVLRLSLRSGGLLALLIMSTIGSQFVFAPAAFAQGYVPLSGAGSTWSFTAIDQWRRTVDFAVSETEYGLNDGGVVDEPPSLRTFGYLPTVAGGTAFMYNLKIDNKRVTNLRLSGDLLAKNAPQPPECDRKGGPAQCTTGTGGVPTPTPPIGGPPVPPPGGPPAPPRGPPAPPTGGTSCLAGIHLLLEGLPRAVAEASRNGNGQGVWRARWADEVMATVIRTYQRHVRDLLRYDSLVARVAETAGSTPGLVIDR
jgi:hypothetical protein